MNKTIGILGNGAQADELESYLSETMSCSFRAVSSIYFDASPHLVNINESTHLKEHPVVAAVGTPAGRKKMVSEWPGDNFVTIVSGSAYVDMSSELGQGTIVAPNAAITTNVTLGQHNLINIAATISHDCTTGDYVTLSPGSHLAGNVKIGDGVFVGIGAIISNGVSVAEGSIIGAGAVVMEDIVEKNSVAVGVPAKVIKKNEGWMSDL